MAGIIEASRLAAHDGVFWKPSSAAPTAELPAAGLPTPQLPALKSGETRTGTQTALDVSS